MYKNQFGNNLLYLLSEKSEKKPLKWTVFKGYVEDLCQHQAIRYDEKIHQVNYSKNLKDNVKNPSKNRNYNSWLLARDLSAMAYLDMGGKTGETVVKVAPPMLAELPFCKLIFLLTGARSPELLSTIKKSVKNHSKVEVEIKLHSRLPDTVFIKSENRSILQEWLNDTSFQGNILSDYIKISPKPPAWDILEFAGSLIDYKDSLDTELLEGDSADIKKIFDINSLNFKPFNKDKNRLEHDLSLVKILHQEAYYKYYLFSKTDQKKVEIQLDWGKFLIAKQLNYLVLKYDKQTFKLSSSLRLPIILERGLTLLSGNPCEDLKSDKNKKYKSQEKRKSNWIFKNVPYKAAKLVADKLGQELQEI